VILFFQISIHNFALLADVDVESLVNPRTYLRRQTTIFLRTFRPSSDDKSISAQINFRRYFLETFDAFAPSPTTPTSIGDFDTLPSFHPRTASDGDHFDYTVSSSILLLIDCSIGGNITGGSNSICSIDRANEKSGPDYRHGAARPRANGDSWL
jgi:hypothetical protein